MSKSPQLRLNTSAHGITNSPLNSPYLVKIPKIQFKCTLAIYHQKHPQNIKICALGKTCAVAQQQNSSLNLNTLENLQYSFCKMSGN